MASPTDPAESLSVARQIVIVIGPGRSGTSTVAGALAHCGFEVPGRVIRGNPTNPSGFYEPRWVVDYHRELLKRHHVGTIDCSPKALDIITAAVEGSRDRERLSSWLGQRLEKQPRLVVKDPRSIWFQRMWTEIARELDAELGFVTMLRHPAAVSASRRTYYAATNRGEGRAQEIERIAGWVNGLLAAELVTRDAPRVFVPYAALVTDWRTQLNRIGAALSLSFEPDISGGGPHPVDTFIRPDLHRIGVDWTDVDVPEWLRDLGEQVWQLLSAVADDKPGGVIAETDRLRAEYAELFADAQALTRDATLRARLAARRRGMLKARAEMESAESAAGSLTSRFRSLLKRGRS